MVRISARALGVICATWRYAQGKNRLVDAVPVPWLTEKLSVGRRLSAGCAVTEAIRTPFDVPRLASSVNRWFVNSPRLPAPAPVSAA
jgi:hypothetical protein